MVEAVKIPVTVKMRRGWDDKNITAPELARILEEAGAAAIFIHGRTREQGFSGRVNLAGIRSVVEAVDSIPVIGNGDITTPRAAKVMIDETGCDGISIGRGAFYNPWIFLQTEHYLKTGEQLPEASFEERIEVMRHHLDQMIEFFGEERGCRMFRRCAKRYSTRFGPSNYFNRLSSTLSSREEFEEILSSYREWRKKFLDAGGELLPQFRPRPLTPSFLPESVEGVAIRVPKGPIEVW